MDTGKGKIRIYCVIRYCGESCNSGSLFMFGRRWSGVSGQQCFLECGEGKYKKILLDGSDHNKGGRGS